MLRPTVLAATLAAILATSASADPKWIRVNSEHFEMNTMAGEGSARDTLKYFEQVRGFFLQIFGDLNKKPLPISIVAFSSEKEYRPYRPNEVAAAFYQPGAERDYIVLGNAGYDAYPVAVHEYVHLLARHADFNFPIWLNEGIADLYSTLKPDGDKIIVGTPPPGRLRTLTEEKWVPLAIILAVDAKSPYYNEKNKAGSLYSESWALTHMLMLSQEYRPGFDKFLAAIANQQSPEAALISTYGKPVEKIDKDLQAYVRQSTVRGLVFPTKLQKNVGDFSVSALSPFEAKLRLAELLQRPGNEPQARHAAEELIAEQPQRAEPYVLLGYLDWRHGQVDGARQNFRKAFDLGNRSPRMLWDYGRMVGGDTAQTILAFSRLLEDDPARLDVRMELASAFLRSKQAQGALATLKKVPKITPEDAPRFFRLCMRAEYDAGNFENAKAAAKKMIEYTKDESEKAEAQSLLDYLEARKTNPASTPVILEAQDDSLPDSTPGNRPTLRRSAGDNAQTIHKVRPVELPSATGAFVELQCDGDTATLILEVAKGDVKRFLLDQPDKVILRRPQAGTVELTCGKQKPGKVRVEYAPPPAGSKVDGLVRMLEWSEQDH